MMRYLILNGVVLLLLVWWAHKCLDFKTAGGIIRDTSFFIAVLTLVFDPLIIAAGIVAYNRALTLGVNVWGAPIEDVAYALAAGLLIPLLWKQYETR